MKFKVICLTLIFCLLASFALMYYQSKNIKSLEQSKSSTQEDKKSLDEMTMTIESKDKEIKDLKEQLSRYDFSGSTDWQHYVNTKYGFKLDFPESWKGYEVSEFPGGSGMECSYSFTMKSQEKGWENHPVNMMIVRVYTPKNYQEEIIKLNKALDENKYKVFPFHAGTIMTSNGYIFVYSPSDEYPDGLKNRIAEVPSILKTFRSK